MPVLAKLKTRTGRLWVYVRDDRPFGGQGPPPALYDYSPTRHGENPRRVLAAWSGVMQADAFAGYNALYDAERKPAPVVEAACWSHGRRDFFHLAKLGKSPISAEIVRRIDEIFAIEREINGAHIDARRAVRQARSKPLVVDLQTYMGEQLRRLSPKNDVAKAIRYMLTRWTAFTRFVDDGRIFLSNNAAKRALRRVAVGRRNWTFAGSDEGASYCSSGHVFIYQRDFSGDRQTAGVANDGCWLRGARRRLPTRRWGLSMARPCMAGSRRGCARRSSDARLTC